MSTLAEAPALQKEPLELWDHFISDKLIYFCDTPMFDLERRSRFIGWATKYKLGRTRIDVDLVLDRKRDSHFCAIIEREKSKPILILNRTIIESDAGGVDSHRSVFIEVAQGIKNPEGVTLEVIPSVVRLKKLDDVDCLTGNIPGDAPEPLLAPLVPVSVDGEDGVSGRGRLVHQGKLPRKLVKTGTQIVGKLSDKQWDQCGERLELKADDLDSLFDIILYRTGYGFRTKKSLNFKLKRLEMISSSGDFHIAVR